MLRKLLTFRIKFLLKHGKLVDIEVDGIDTRDYPDFCDAYICAAAVMLWGRLFELTDFDLDYIGDYHSDWAHEFAYERVF